MTFNKTNPNIKTAIHKLRFIGLRASIGHTTVFSGWLWIAPGKFPGDKVGGGRLYRKRQSAAKGFVVLCRAIEVFWKWA
jgi:hypothetical protein